MILDQDLQILKIYSTQEEALRSLDDLILKGFPLVKIFLLGPNGLTVKPENSLPLNRLIEQEKIGTVTGTRTGLTKGFFGKSNRECCWSSFGFGSSLFTRIWTNCPIISDSFYCD